MIAAKVDKQQADEASRLLEDTLRNRSKKEDSPSATANSAPQNAPAVRITRTNEISTQPAPADRFTGSARVRRLSEPMDPARASAGLVTFEPGARTAWHIHPLGQTLIVTSGTGWVQQWGRGIEEMREGDVVQIPAGVKHWHGATLTGALASTSANAIVTFSSQYLVGPTVTGNAGVGVGNVLTVEAFYDPLHATLAYQDSVFTIHNFDAQYAGLRITVGDLVWQTTGPLSISTTVERREGNVVATSIDFLGSTNPSYQGAVATTLSTPWNIIGNASIGFSPRFETSGEVTGPRLFDQNDVGSILLPMTRYYMGGAYADTSSGRVHFNFNDPAALGLPPVSSVPEPGTLGLFALGGAGLLFRRARAKRKDSSAAATPA